MSYQKTLYKLDVRKHNELPFKIDVKESISVGADPRNDIVLVGKKSLNKHLIFEIKGENLSLSNLGQLNQTFLNSIPLEFNKNYLLEAGDHVQIPELEILIGLLDKSNEQAIKPVVFQSSSNLIPESASVTSTVGSQESEAPPIKIEVKVQNSNKPLEKEGLSTSSIISLLAIKLYALLTDFFLTFFLLSFIIPLAGIEEIAFSIFKSLNELLFPYSAHSLWPFFLLFYFLRLTQILIFGTSLGQLLMGLGSTPKKTVLRIIGFRIKIVFCALFLYPAQNKASGHFFFSALRKVGIVLFLLFVLISPLFISQIMITDLRIPEKPDTQELNTISYVTYSENYKLSLKLEIPPRYQIFPLAASAKNKNSFGIKIYDLQEKVNLEITEHQNLFIDSLEEALRFSNPFLSFHQKLPLRDQSLSDQKLIIQKILLTSINDIPSQMQQFGPFFASNVFAKNFLLNKMENKDLQLKTFSKEAPFLFLENQNSMYTMIFSGERLCILKHDKTKGNSALQNLTYNQILNKWRIKDSDTNYQSLDFLEILDALKRQDEQTVLTYYINSAKKSLETKRMFREVDLTEAYKAALISNIDDLMPTMTLNNTKTSLEEIKNQLTPMENPGVKR